MSDRRRGGFTLLELLVCLGLSTVLLGVIAAAVQGTIDVRDQALTRVDGQRGVSAALDVLGRDAARAVAPPDLSRSFVVTCHDEPRADPTAPAAHVDALELVILDASGLQRVRYSVAWDPAQDAGYLWREQAPVAPGELVGPLRALAGTVRAGAPELLLSGVTRLRVRVPDASGVTTADPVGGLLDGDVALAWTGRGAVVHDRLTLAPDAPAEALRPGALLWLQDDALAQAGTPPGYYPVLRAEGGQVTLGRSAGLCERAVVRARWLPARVQLELEAEGQLHALELCLPASAHVARLTTDAWLAVRGSP